MRSYVASVEKNKTPEPGQASQFSRALTILYGLQSSLNFDEGGEIAENLFRLYEYARQQLLTTSRDGHTDGAIKAIDAIEGIRDAWRQIDAVTDMQVGGAPAE